MHGGNARVSDVHGQVTASSCGGRPPPHSTRPESLVTLSCHACLRRRIALSPTEKMTIYPRPTKDSPIAAACVWTKILVSARPRRSCVCASWVPDAGVAVGEPPRVWVLVCGDWLYEDAVWGVPPDESVAVWEEESPSFANQSPVHCPVVLADRPLDDVLPC